VDDGYKRIRKCSWFEDIRENRKAHERASVNLRKKNKHIFCGITWIKTNGSEIRGNSIHCV